MRTRSTAQAVYLLSEHRGQLRVGCFVKCVELLDQRVLRIDVEVELKNFVDLLLFIALEEIGFQEMPNGAHFIRGDDAWMLIEFGVDLATSARMCSE